MNETSWAGLRGERTPPSGPLAGTQVVELGGIGPGPFCAMLLADMGADVVRVVRPSELGAADPALHRGRIMLTADLKDPDDRARVLQLIADADVVIEGFRPGVVERLGLGPDDCAGINAALVYGRMTGYGQEGPLAQQAGHDINYISIAGALSAIGRSDPVPPLNLVGDMGGGGMLLAFGIVCALVEARKSGWGQVVDAAIVDGVALQLTMIFDMLAKGTWTDQRSNNTLDGAAPFYDVYRCSDGGYVAVGAIEKKFYLNLLVALDLIDEPVFAKQWDRDAWPRAKARLAEVFASRSRDEWAAALQDQNACVTPVLSLIEATDFQANISRAVYDRDAGGAIQPAPAPRFSRTQPGRRWAYPDAVDAHNGRP